MTDGADAGAAMESVLQRLRRALAAGGDPGLRHPGSGEVLDHVAAAIAPLRLPAEVEAFWRLTDGSCPGSALFPHPRVTDPGFALEGWQEHVRQPGLTPDLLFPVGYESHAFLLVELDGPDGGGACFTWAYGAERFVLAAADLTGYLEVAAETLEAGHLERHEHDGQVFHTIDDEAFRGALRERLRSAPHPGHGDAAEIGADPASWPRRWVASVGPVSTEQRARGATTTIAALLAPGPGPAVTGRVHAVVRELWGSSDGVRVTIDDGTGTIDAWCPAPVTLFGPACGRRYEFDLVITPDPPPPARAEAVAVRLLGDISG